MDQIAASEQIRFHDVGHGQPVILLHSLLADAASWDDLTPILRAEARVIVADLPGFAGLPPITGGLAPVAAALGEAIDRLALAAPPVLVGNGYGSFLALQLALDRPDLVAGLVLIGCGAVFSEPGRAAFRAMRDAAAARGLAAIADTAMARLFGASFREQHPELMAARRAAFLRTDPQTFAAACTALATLDITAQAGRIVQPALLLAGSEDQATPPAMAQDLAARLPAARFERLDGLAHVPQLQDPRGVAEAILRFMKDLPPPA
jgi:3-oxoadipate enol-lactonase